MHWLLAALIPFSWWSATHDHLPWHRLSGYTILGLLVFRLVWGFVGSPTARFARFLRGPRRVMAYIGGKAKPVVGHNPLGGWSVAAMLLVLAAQVGLGLFSVDEDGIEAGPLSKFLSFDISRAIAHLHAQLFWVLVGLVGLHISAVAVYAMRRKNLVWPMISGAAPLPDGAEAQASAPAWRIPIVVALAAAVAWFVAHGLTF
jgi:cytochrome b